MQPNEIAVLKALKDGKPVTIEELQSSTNLDHAAVARAVYSLAMQGMARIEESKKISATLTAEGQQVLADGLPESRLLKEIGKKTVPLSQIKTSPREVAVSWAKQRGWIELTKDGVKATGAGLKATDAEQKEIVLLKNLAAANKQDLELLRRRRFVDFEEKIARRAWLTSAGVDMAKKARPLEEVSQLTPELIRTGGWKKARLRKYNVTAAGPKMWPGKAQPYRVFLEEVKRKLTSLGFREMRGPLIDLEFWNFDALFQPQNHPARDWTSSYQLKYPERGRLPQNLVTKVKAAHESGGNTGSTGWGYKWSAEQAARLVPRAHTTTLSARQLAAGVEIPGKYFTIGRVFRPDIMDAKHLIEFNQLDGIVIDSSLTFRNLLGILKIFAEEIAGAKEVRFAPSYFPFTEPSVELQAKHPKLGWVELGGAGIFREELTRPLGVKEPVIAWGLGIDRLAMLKLGINDIRYLFSYDLSWLRAQKVV